MPGNIRPSSYHHTQRGYLHIVLGLVAAIMLTTAWFTSASIVVALLLTVAAVLLIPMSFAIAHLTVHDDGHALVIRYGPLPIFGTRIKYSQITSVETAKSALIDGWGIHYLPGRGWTYNLWGPQCVKLHLGKRVVRIGSDDAEKLADFIKTRIGSRTL